MTQTPAGQLVQDLYESNSPVEWDQFLGPVNYHYHFGFPGDSLNIFENAIRQNVFPFIADKSRVLDCGCGWGAPAKMLQKEKKCKVTCVTNSCDQVSFIKARQKGLNVIKADLNNFKPLKRYDVALFYESLSHVANQKKLLENIALIADNILLIDHTDKRNASCFHEHWHMDFQSIPVMQQKLIDAGYKIQYCTDLGSKHIVPTSLYWKSRLDLIKPIGGQLAMLQMNVEAMLADPEQAAKESGLALIYASKNL